MKYIEGKFYYIQPKNGNISTIAQYRKRYPYGRVINRLYIFECVGAAWYKEEDLSLIEPVPEYNPPLAEAQREVDEFNAKYSPGTKGWLHLSDGEKKQTCTLTGAFVLCGNTAAIMVKGISGAYHLDSFEPAW